MAAGIPPEAAQRRLRSINFTEASDIHATSIRLPSDALVLSGMDWFALISRQLLAPKLGSAADLEKTKWEKKEDKNPGIL